MSEEIKKTAEAHGTVSEATAKEKAEDSEGTTKEMMIKESKEETVIGNKEKEKKIQKLEEKDSAEKSKPRKRLTREEEARVESLNNWKPKTKLGMAVQKGEIKNIDEILESKQKIMEEHVVDTIVPIKSDLIAMGQAKGKFGGGKRRAWRQTQRKTREGNVLTFSAMAVVGDGKGHVGVGVGEAQETLPARDKAIRKAKLNLIQIKRSCASFDCSCSEKHSIPFVIKGKCGSVIVKLMPAPQGTGLVVANELKKVLRLAGIKDVYSKTFGQNQTTFNLVKACIEALKKTNPGLYKK
jgi:small subunit ribosomal protein S5